MDTKPDTIRLEKALKLLRMLDFNRALAVFYQLLDENPQDISIIQQIYKIELGRQSVPGLKKLFSHIFSIQSMRSELTPLVTEAAKDYKVFIDAKFSLQAFNRQQIFTLAYHLSQKPSFNNEVERLIEEVKQRFSEDPLTPQTLFNYCERLVRNKQIIQARKELKYLLTYYTESKYLVPAEKLLRSIT